MQVDIWVKYNETKRFKVLVVKRLLQLFKISAKVIPEPKNKFN